MATSTKQDDARWMQLALRLGWRALGTTAENPAVGCVLVKQGRLLALGWTQPGGRPHAETHALQQAGDTARGATAYVTLEPCAHHGRTPPCAEALVAAGIARCVIAVEDPDPRVAGRGTAALRQAGIEIALGEGAEEARQIHAGFFSRILNKRPYVILKLALSADGMVAAGPGQRTAITGVQVRARVHLLRAQCDAILVGRRTVEVDDPELNVRLPGLESRSPAPYVLGTTVLPPESKLARAGATLLPTLELEPLARDGINRLMVEGGSQTARAFLQHGLVEEVHLFQSPRVLGPQGVPAFPGQSLAEALAGFRPMHEESLGEDRLTVYGKA